ncbi:MAG: hypothetical protein U5K54_25715 [Cytophagales bacterium]|nr:hypothetical protein [Cytophagales bacterium]
MKKLKIDGSRLIIQGQNLLTFTNFLGIDPESQNVSFPPSTSYCRGPVFS